MKHEMDQQLIAFLTESTKPEKVEQVLDIVKVYGHMERIGGYLNGLEANRKHHRGRLLIWVAGTLLQFILFTLTTIYGGKGPQWQILVFGFVSAGITYLEYRQMPAKVKKS